MTREIPARNVAELLSGYRARRLSPVDVATACLKQVFKYNPLCNAVCHVDEKAVMEQARASARRWKQGRPKGPLDGIPVTVKDWFDVAGWPTRYGSQVSSSRPSAEDSPSVARLREAGAIFLAKTTLPEYGHKGVTDSPLHGITRNPWNLEKTPGGSSGGAAVAAATGMAPLNLGSDAGGSIRIPASFTGVVGFKPSPGLVSSWPPSPFASIAAQGPLTRSVADAAAMLDVLVRPDPRDWNRLPVDAPGFAAALRGRLPRLRVAYAPALNGTRADKDVRAVIDAKIKCLSVLGPVTEISLKCPSLVDVFLRHWTAIASAHVARLTPAQKKRLDPHYRQWAEQGDALHLHDYVDAERERMHIGAYFKGILDDYDLLVTPTMPMVAFDAGHDMPPRFGKAANVLWTPYTLPANLAKLPAASLPVGLTARGLPVGIQIMGRYLDDALVLRAAQRLEKEFAFKGWQAHHAV